MKIGLFFGSYNPIHIGHLLAATCIREATELDEVWFVVSPQNPFKKSEELANELHRLEMAKLALQNSPYLKVSDIEFGLSKPSYTHHTLKELTGQYPKNTFHIIIGEDLLEGFNTWKEAEWIKVNFKIIVYNRKVDSSQSIANRTGQIYRLPLFDISSTEIRNRIKNNLSIRFFVTDSVEQYIVFHKIYL